MTNPDNKALNATETRNKRGYRIAIILLLLAMLSTFAYVCNKVKMVEPTDYKKKYRELQAAMDINNKQFGLKKAQWEKEVVISEQRDKEQQAKIIALQERSNIAMAKYNKVVELLKQTAPIDCQEYIAQVDSSCKNVISVKDSTIEDATSRNDSLKMDLMKTLGFVKVQNDKIQTDSTHKAELNRHIFVLNSEIETLVKSNKRAKFWGKAAVVVAVVWTGFVMYVTVVK